jgi:hypothetical protein
MRFPRKESEILEVGFELRVEHSEPGTIALPGNAVSFPFHLLCHRGQSGLASQNTGGSNSLPFKDLEGQTGADLRNIC